MKVFICKEGTRKDFKWHTEHSQNLGFLVWQSSRAFGGSFATALSWSKPDCHPERLSCPPHMTVWSSPSPLCQLQLWFYRVTSLYWKIKIKKSVQNYYYFFSIVLSRLSPLLSVSGSCGHHRCLWGRGKCMVCISTCVKVWKSVKPHLQTMTSSLRNVRYHETNPSRTSACTNALTPFHHLQLQALLRHLRYKCSLQLTEKVSLGSLVPAVGWQRNAFSLLLTAWEA